jgi:type IV pilus assembly protein PilX
MKYRLKDVPQPQSGAVLVVVLVLLVVLTILGINGAQQSAMEERMSGNFRDKQIGFEVSEAVLRVAEDIIIDPTTFNAISDSDWVTSGDSSDGLYEGDQGLDPISGTHARKSVSSVRGESAADPDYFIERLPEIYMAQSSLVKGFPEQPPKIRIYRATSRANGISVNTEAILQSTIYR